jgi:type VI protein secretion system component Hcp
MLSMPGGERLLQRWFWFRYPGQAPPRSSGFSAVLTIEDGGARDDKKSFPVLSFYWGIQQQQRAWENKETGEKARPLTQEFSVVKRVDALSAALFQAAAQGDKLDKVVVVLEKGGEAYATYTFGNVYVSSIRPSGGSGGEHPLADVSFNFESVSYDYKK